MKTYSVKVRYEAKGPWRTCFDRPVWIPGSLDGAVGYFERIRDKMRGDSPVEEMVILKGEALLARTERRFVVRR